jgi:hypothetical protein
MEWRSRFAHLPRDISHKLDTVRYDESKHAAYKEVSSMQDNTVTAEVPGSGLTEGMQVVGADGNQLGTLDGVMRSSTTGQPSAILVKHGRVIHKRKQIPAFEIHDVEPDRVILDFDAKEFKLLPNVDDVRV